MRILLVYPGHRFSTFDVAEGYANALEEMGHTVCRCNYHDSVDFYTHSLMHWYSDIRGNGHKSPSHEKLLMEATLLGSERVAIEALDFAPDVAILVNGLSLHRRAFYLLEVLSVPKVLLLTESPYLDEQQSVIVEKGWIKGVLVNDKLSVKLYADMGIKTEYLPHSYDPKIHFPGPVGTFFQSDVFFWGTLWPERKDLGNALDRISAKTIWGGPDPEHDNEDNVDELLANSELAKYYRGTKIAPNMHRKLCWVKDGEPIMVSKAYSLGPRAYEIAACGAFQLCDNTRPELFDLFGDTVATFEDKADFSRKIGYYLRHDNERNDMAKAAMDRVKDCTFSNRAENIIVPMLEYVT